MAVGGGEQLQEIGKALLITDESDEDVHIPGNYTSDPDEVFDLHGGDGEGDRDLASSLTLIQRRRRWELNWQEAAIYLQEGQSNDKFTSHPKSYKELPAYLRTHSLWFHVLDLVASLLLLGLVTIERPAVFKVPVGVHASLELCSLIIIGLELALKMRWLGLHTYMHHRRTMIKTVCLVVMVAEAIAVLVRQSSHFRITRAIRPLFFVDSYYLRGVRRFIRQIIQSLPPILDMFLLLLFFMLMFSLLGFYIFKDIDPAFDNIQDSFVSLFVLLTTANFPDVMMTVYAYNRWFASFFITYLSLELFLLMNLFLAVVYDTFSKVEKKKVKNLLLHKRRASERAFQLLVTKKKPYLVGFQQFLGLMKHFKPKLTQKELYLSFKIMNKSLSGDLTQAEFYGIYSYTSLRWKRTERAEMWSAEFRPVLRECFKGLNWIVTSQGFIWGVYVMIGLNFIWVFTDAIGGFDARINTTVTGVFVSVYILEAGMKILGLGPIEYFSSGWTVFDFLVTFLGALGLALDLLHQGFYVLVILRPLRLLSLFQVKRRFRDVLGTIFILTSQMLSISIVLLMVYYVFAIVGMEVFGSKDMRNCCINSSVENYYKDKNSSDTKLYYYLNSFEHVFIAGVTLFELTVVNNWHIIMEAYAYEFTDWSRIYFMLFYIVTMVILTVTVSFILEAFLFRMQYRTAMQGHDIDDDAVMRLDVSLTPQELLMVESQATPLSTQYLASQRDHMEQNLIWFRGERHRSKNDFSERMYKEEVQEWIAEEERHCWAQGGDLEEGAPAAQPAGARTASSAGEPGTPAGAQAPDIHIQSSEPSVCNRVC